MIGETVSHYRVLEKIGGGGMGVVYQAEDIRLGRIVALKFLHAGLTSNEANRKRFLREAQAASLIDHPNVCHVYQVEETDDGRLFIAMAYYGGHSLRAAIEAGPLLPRQAFEIAFSVAQGLWAAHRRGIVHRDIKPGNVVVSDDGFVKIVDFGLALLAGQSRVTTGGARVGTVAYMSPEQASSASVDERTDIWSLGVVMYEMMTGQLPFRGDVDAALLFSIRSEPHPPLREANGGVPEACARVVERCLAKSPDDRYPSVEALLADMVAAANECGWSDTVASRTIAPILAAKKRRTWARRATVATAVAAVAAGGWWLWSRRGPPSPYTTEVRLAVLPFENRLGADDQTFVDSVTDLASQVAGRLSRAHPSMWTVRQQYVESAQLPGAEAAAPSFGVNRVVTGDVQRFQNGRRLNLVLRDAETLDAIRATSIDFEPAAASALVNGLPTKLAELVGIDADALPARSVWHTDDPVAASLFIEGLGELAAKGSASSARAAAIFDSCCARDTMFAAALATAAFADFREYERTDDLKWLDRAEARGRTARARFPEADEAWVLLGNVWLERSEPDSAAAMFRTALVRDPGNLNAARRLGRVLVSQSRLDEAESVYLGVIAARPDYWVTHRTIGTFYYDQDRMDDAAREFRRAVELAPHDALSLANLGAVYYLQGDWARFRELSLESFRIRPDCESCSNVATALYFERKFEESAKYFQLALSPQYCDSTDYLMWGNLASALYWVDGERERAQECYRRAIRLGRERLGAAGDDPKLIGVLIDYYAMSGDTSRTREMIARAEGFLADNERVMYRVGSAYEKLGQRELAIHHLGNAFRHGMPLPEIEGDPTLDELVRDPRFKEMVRSQAAAEGAKTATVKK